MLFLVQFLMMKNAQLTKPKEMQCKSEIPDRTNTHWSPFRDANQNANLLKPLSEQARRSLEKIPPTHAPRFIYQKFRLARSCDEATSGNYTRRNGPLVYTMPHGQANVQKRMQVNDGLFYRCKWHVAIQLLLQSPAGEKSRHQAGRIVVYE